MGDVVTVQSLQPEILSRLDTARVSTLHTSVVLRLIGSKLHTAGVVADLEALRESIDKLQVGVVPAYADRVIREAHALVRKWTTSPE